MSKAARIWWALLAVLLALAIWLSASGGIVLRGFSAEVLTYLAQGRGLLHIADEEWKALPLHYLSGDLLAWTSALTVLTNLLGAVAIYAAGLSTWKNPISPTLAVGVAYFAETTMWVKTATPLESLTHLLLGLAIAALISGAVPLLSLFILTLAMLDPAQAVMLLPVLAYLSYRRQTAYGLVVPALALLGVGCLLIPIGGNYRLEPSLAGYSLLTVAPLLLLALPGSIRQARAGIYLSLLIGSALTGRAELASLFALADLAFTGLKALEEPGSTEEVSSVRVRGSLAVTLLSTFALVWAVLPGEQFLNRQILIPAQKAKVPFGELWGFFSLDRHARLAAQDGWRAKAPFPEMTAADFEKALELSQQTLPQGIAPLTPGQLEESLQVGLLYALVSNQPLRGWDRHRHLAGPLLLSKLRKKNLLSQGPLVLFRESGTVREMEPARKPSTLAELDLRRIIILPYRPQEVSSKPGAGYRWVSSAGEFEVSFTDTPAEVFFSAEPGEVRIISLHPSHATRHIEVAPFQASLSELPKETLPSRSLVPLRLRLKNTGEVAIGSEMLSSWNLRTVEDESFGAFSQHPTKEYLLYPGESTTVDFDLATPEAEGLYHLAADVRTPDGSTLEVTVDQSSPIRTWRRTPPVGTWVEEP